MRGGIPQTSAVTASEVLLCLLELPRHERCTAQDDEVFRRTSCLLQLPNVAQTLLCQPLGCLGVASLIEAVR